jgi:uncharacterized surface protein with fasciclin (FAS1) repeats
MLTTNLLLAATLMASAPIADPPALDLNPPALDLLDVAEQAGSFTTLAAALEAAELTDALRGDGPFTVFAPTDEAFAQLPEGTVEALLQPGARAQLTAILTYHVIPSRVSAAEAISVGSADSLQGETLSFRIEDGRLRVGDASISSNDIQASNGVIHVIDSVLLPPQPEAPQPLTAFDILGLAIERGAPLFNEGQPAACSAIYEIACRAVLDLDADNLPAGAARALQGALVAAMQEVEPRLQAWSLRNGIDRAMAALASQPVETAAASPRLRDQVIFDFANVRKNSWPSVNDNVMGGISEGRSRITEAGTALFLGALSLENNGGFSTIRSSAEDLELAGWDGLILRVRGDGRSYNFSALTNDSRRELHYWEHAFDTEADEWIEVKVPFDALSHRVMGWTIPDGPIDPATIRSLAFGVSDKNTAPFALEVDSIKAYRAS